MKYLFLSLIFLISCSAIPEPELQNKLIKVSSNNQSDRQMNITLFLSNTEINGNVIPEDLKNEINNSLRWKWHSTDKLPNACYFIEYLATEDEPADFDFGFAMLEFSAQSVSGNLLLWPDAGFKINLKTPDGGSVSGNSEFWGGPVLTLLDENGNDILEQEEPERNSYSGVSKKYSSIDECFNLIRSKNLTS
jgi:hypothetical protein